MGERRTTPGPARRRFAARVALAWLLVAGCIAMILTFSGDDFSARSTWRFLSDWIRWVWPDVPRATLRGAHLWVRKSAHFLEYAALGLLTCRAAWLSFDAGWKRTLGLALGVVVAVAAVDETRQALSLARTGSPLDVALDVAGGVVGLAVLMGLQRRSRGELAPAPPPAA